MVFQKIGNKKSNLPSVAFRGHNLLNRFHAKPRLGVLLGGWFTLAAVLVSTGCSNQPSRQIDSYDFGITATTITARIAVPLVVAEVQAPSWMENAGLYYRLAYLDAAKPQAYANSRWVMPPAELLTRHLRSTLRAASKAAVLTPADGARVDHVLRVDLDEFAQVFDATDKSRGVLRVSARLLKGRDVVATRVFNIEQPAASANAEGGVRALTSASNLLGQQVADWLTSINLR